jgi:hypothetical protein
MFYQRVLKRPILSKYSYNTLATCYIFKLNNLKIKFKNQINIKNIKKKKKKKANVAPFLPMRAATHPNFGQWEVALSQSRGGQTTLMALGGGSTTPKKQNGGGRNHPQEPWVWLSHPYLA